MNSPYKALLSRAGNGRVEGVGVWGGGLMSDKEGKGGIKRTWPPTVVSHDLACLGGMKLRLSRGRLENYNSTEP